jgi:hypothetical protein
MKLSTLFRAYQKANQRWRMIIHQYDQGAASSSPLWRMQKRETRVARQCLTFESAIDRRLEQLEAK